MTPGNFIKPTLRHSCYLAALILSSESIDRFMSKVIDHMKNHQELPVKKYFISSIGHLYKAVFLLYFFICSYSGHRQIDKASEYNLKAAFIYNFTKFIEWKTASADNEFIIGIIGASPINDPLVEVIKTETVDGKKIII